MRHRPTTLLASTIAALVLVTGCASGGAARPDAAQAGAEEAATTTEPTTESPGSTAAGFPRGTGLQQGEGQARRPLVFTDVRVVEKDGFDRLVMRFRGSGAPGWVVRYVGQPRLEGSGERVDLDGDSFLNVFATDTTWPAPGYYDGPTQLRPRAGGQVTDVYVGGTLEGFTQVLVGVEGDRAPFRVTARADPARLMVDVTHDS